MACRVVSERKEDWYLRPILRLTTAPFSYNLELRKRSASELGDISNESLDIIGQVPDDSHDDRKRKLVNGDNLPQESTENPSNDEERTSIDEEEPSDDEKESPYEPSVESFDTRTMFDNVLKHCPGVYVFDKECICLLRMYDMCGKSFRLNDVIEVVGIYTDDPWNIGCQSRLIPGHIPRPEDSEDLSQDEEGEYPNEFQNVFQDLPTDRYVSR